RNYAPAALNRALLGGPSTSPLVAALTYGAPCMSLDQCRGFAVGVLTLLAGCVPITKNSPIVRNQLQTISAGHTGCMPEENQLSNVKDSADGATWNATCKGKVYLCTGVSDLSNSRTYSCAPVAQ